MAYTRDPKTMAKTLRTALAAHDITVSHSQSLELVAKQLGFKDWNTAAAYEETHAAKPLPDLRLPFGWHVSGTQARDYSIGIDDDDPSPTATIRSLDKEAPYVGFATLMQSINAHPFQGQRLQLVAHLKTEDVPDAATVWMRVDDVGGKTLAFDNMEQRVTDGVLRNTCDWTERRIVLDVPGDAESIHYGFYLRGAGQCWARGFDLSTVSKDIDATAQKGSRLDQPTNLGFVDVI